MTVELLRAAGWVALVLTLACAAISIRKRFAYQAPGRLSTWVRAHVWLGMLAAAAVLLHSRRDPGTVLTDALAIIAFLTIATGVWGWILSKTAPRYLTRFEESPSTLDDLLVLRQESLQGLLDLGAQSGSARELLPLASSWRQTWRFLRRGSKVDAELPRFRSASSTPDDTRAAELALRANKAGAELLLHRAMRLWQPVHAAATIVFLVLTLAHVATELYL